MHLHACYKQMFSNSIGIQILVGVHNEGISPLHVAQFVLVTLRVYISSTGTLPLKYCDHH